MRYFDICYAMKIFMARVHLIPNFFEFARLLEIT